MSRNRHTFLRNIFAALAAVLPIALAAEGPQSVPAKYADLYVLLQNDLNAYEAALGGIQPQTPTPVVFSTDLLVANGNRGEALLSPSVMDAVKLYLNRFQELGLAGVTVAIGYPLFDPAFPRNADYVAFYKGLAQEVHGRGMKLDVECAVAFANTVYSSITWDWSGYTVDSLAAAKHAQLQIILSEIQPDYLNLGCETSTEAQLTGITSLTDPQTYAHFVELQAQGLDKGSTVVGAGCSAWENTTTASLIAALPELDSFTFHVYPVDATSRQNSILLGQIARAHGKRVVLDEAWLSKMKPGEGGGVATSASIFKRDTYSFFAPLDQQFLRSMAKLAEADGVEYLSFFWSTYFFAYLDYSDALDAESYVQVMSQVDQKEGTALAADTFTSTGLYCESLVAQYPSQLAADFSFKPASPTDATPVTFTAAASGGTPPYTYTWGFCGTSASGESVTETLALGSCVVTLTVMDSSETAATSSKTVEVGYSIVISGAQWLSNPGRLSISGSGFSAGCQVEINGVKVPQTVFKSATLLVAKGSGLKAMAPKGVTVQISVVSADGRSSAQFPFTR